MDLRYINRPVAVVMITVGLVVFGVISMFRLPTNLLPDLSEPTLTVETRYPDTSPKEVEQEVTKKIEEALGTMRGLKHYESFSQPGKSIVKLRFRWSHSIDNAIQDVRESLDRLRFPDRVERPRVLRYDPGFEPIIRLSFSSKAKSAVVLWELVNRNVKPVLETLPGVATTIIKGGRQEEIAILFSKGHLESLGLSPERIAKVLRDENVTLPTGKFEQGEREIYVRVKSRVRSTEELAQLVVKHIDGRSLRLGDVAKIERRPMEPETLTRAEGSDAVFLDVYREADANIVQVATLIRNAVDQRLRTMRWMRGVDVAVVNDESTFIEQSIANVTWAAIGGALLAMAVLFLFLGELIPSLLIGLSIPVAVPIAIFCLDQKGISLNVMSLGGLALGVGMLVDNSIVVLENIAKKAKEGLPLLQQAEYGTREMLTPVIASTLTTIAVFAPLAFVEGVAGQLFGDLAWAIIFSLTASLAVAVVVLPTLYVAVHSLQNVAQNWGSQPAPDRWVWLPLTRQEWREGWQRGRAFWLTTKGWGSYALARWLLYTPWILVRLLLGIAIDLLRGTLLVIWLMLSGITQGLFWLLSRILKPIAFGAALWRRSVKYLEDRFYPDLLNRSLDRRRQTLMVLGVLMIGSMALATQLGGELLPPLSQSRYFVEGELPLGSGIRKTSSTSFAFEQALKRVDGVKGVVALIGIDQAQALVGNAGIHKFKIQFDIDPDRVDLVTIRQRLAKIEGVEWQLSQPSLGMQSDPIEIYVSDTDLDRLKRRVSLLQQRLKQLPFLVPTRDTLAAGIPEMTVRVLPEQLAALGLSAQDVVDNVARYLRGEEATSLEIGEKTVKVRVKADEVWLRSRMDLSDIKVMTSDQKAVDLASIATIDQGIGPSYIYRNSGSRSIRLSYQLNGMSLSDAKSEILALLPDNNEETEYVLGGQSEEYQRSMLSLFYALLLAAFMVYLVMASQFESFMQPLLIMGTIPLALIGVVLVNFPLGVPLSVMVMVGAIVLVGIIVNNAIVLVDSVNRLRRNGIATRSALLSAGKSRLRPILMTMATTVLGLVPMAFAQGEGAALSSAMARTIIGGLGFGTVLTLIVIPIIFMIFVSGSGNDAASTVEVADG